MSGYGPGELERAQQEAIEQRRLASEQIVQQMLDARRDSREWQHLIFEWKGGQQSCWTARALNGRYFTALEMANVWDNTDHPWCEMAQRYFEDPWGGNAYCTCHAAATNDSIIDEEHEPLEYQHRGRNPGWLHRLWLHARNAKAARADVKPKRR